MNGIIYDIFFFFLILVVLYIREILCMEYINLLVFKKILKMVWFFYLDFVLLFLFFCVVFFMLVNKMDVIICKDCNLYFKIYKMFLFYF